MNTADVLNCAMLAASLLLFHLYQQILPVMPTPQRFPDHFASAKLVDSSENFKLQGTAWPSAFGRAVEGGRDDKFVSQEVQPGRADQFFVRVDGPVVYSSKNGEKFNVAFLQPENTVLIYTIPAGKAIEVEVNTPHSHPFSEEAREFSQTARLTNGVFEVQKDGKYELPSAKTAERKLSADFAGDKLQIEDSSSNAEYDVVVSSSVSGGHFKSVNGKQQNVVSARDWPLLKVREGDSSVEALEQEFTMEWVDEGDNKEILFKGLTGSLTGGEGRPGVVYDKNAKTISVNLLLSRPDGSFFISTDNELIMIIAQPDSESGEPLKNSLEAIRFKNGAKLPAGWWHSVPFPPPNVDKIRLYEKVASTNANSVINVREETGAPLLINL